MRKIILILLCALSLCGIEAQKRKPTEPKVTIRDIFLALPDDALENRWTVEERKELLTQIGCPKNKEEAVPPFIDVCDERRGYLRVYYAYPESRRVEVCYWNLKDGRKLVAASETEGISQLKFYIYDRGRIRLGGFLAPDISQVKLEDFYDTSGLTPKQRSELSRTFQKRALFRYTLPRNGTSLEMHMGFPIQDMDYETTFLDTDYGYLKQCRYIIFHWKNERWTKEVKTLPAIDQDEDCQCL